MEQQNKQNEYPCMVLHNELENGKILGRIIITGFSVRIEFEKGNLELPYQGLLVKRGGAGNSMIFLEHPARPGWIVYTNKKKIINHFRSDDHPELSKQVSDIRKSELKIRTIILIIVLSVAALLTGLYFLRNPVTNAIAKNIPKEWEISLGNSVFEAYKQEKRIIETPAIVDSLNKILSPLLQSIPDRRYEFKVFIFEDSTLNAFALPGGNIVLNTGLLTEAGSAEEILGVVAHEISHVTLQHGIRKMLDSLGLLFIIKAVLWGDSGFLGDLIGNGAFLLNQEFSRSFEREADETGFSYLLGARINPVGMIGFFQRILDKKEKEGGAKLERALNFLSTHPDPGKRIRYLSEMMAQLKDTGHFIDFDSSFKEFKEKLSAEVKPEVKKKQEL